jgi:hypothetical protein
MWSEIASGLQIFDVYREYIEKDRSLTGVIFDVLVEVIMFGVETVKALKYARPDSRSEVLRYGSSTFMLTGSRRHATNSSLVDRHERKVPDLVR